MVLITALPEEGPRITGGRPRYQIGDTVRVNCTSGRSKPAAQLMWFINGEQVSQVYGNANWCYVMSHFIILHFCKIPRIFLLSKWKYAHFFTAISVISNISVASMYVEYTRNTTKSFFACSLPRIGGLRTSKCSVLTVLHNGNQRFQWIFRRVNILQQQQV